MSKWQFDWESQRPDWLTQDQWDRLHDSVRASNFIKMFKNIKSDNVTRSAWMKLTSLLADVFGKDKKFTVWLDDKLKPRRQKLIGYLTDLIPTKVDDTFIKALELSNNVYMKALDWVGDKSLDLSAKLLKEAQDSDQVADDMKVDIHNLKQAVKDTQREVFNAANERVQAEKAIKRKEREEKNLAKKKELQAQDEELIRQGRGKHITEVFRNFSERNETEDGTYP